MMRYCAWYDVICEMIRYCTWYERTYKIWWDMMRKGYDMVLCEKYLYIMYIIFDSSQIWGLDILWYHMNHVILSHKSQIIWWWHVSSLCSCNLAWIQMNLKWDKQTNKQTNKQTSKQASKQASKPTKQQTNKPKNQTKNTLIISWMNLMKKGLANHPMTMTFTPHHDLPVCRNLSIGFLAKLPPCHSKGKIWWML